MLVQNCEIKIVTILNPQFICIHVKIFSLAFPYNKLVLLYKDMLVDPD
jgi:hypothetical protein